MTAKSAAKRFGNGLLSVGTVLHNSRIDDEINTISDDIKELEKQLSALKSQRAELRSQKI